jgi:hypothetical protein
MVMGCFHVYFENLTDFKDKKYNRTYAIILKFLISSPNFQKTYRFKSVLTVQHGHRNYYKYLFTWNWENGYPRTSNLMWKPLEGQKLVEDYTQQVEITHKRGESHSVEGRQ